MASDNKQGGFTVTDRRTFKESGDAREEGEQAPAEPPPQSAEGAAGHKGAADAAALPAVDFHTFVLSLGSSALLHLGELEHPEAGAQQKDLPLAKHTIDILAMLQEKTKGNLTPGEERLMESLLYDLRLRYVEASKSK
jgi:hypothetical protein